MRKIAVRIDDITPEMDWKRFKRFEDLLDKYGIKPLIGVIPACEDQKLDAGEDRNKDFDDRARYAAWLKERIDEGWTVAVHGYHHVYTTKCGGLFPLNPKAEFAGVRYSRQIHMLRNGRKKLKELGIDSRIFMAPGHSFDGNTLKALKEAGYTYVTDGYGNGPFLRKGLKFLPISFLKDRELKKQEGVTTFVVHTWELEDEDIEEWEKLFGGQRERFIDYGELLSMKARKRSFVCDIAEFLCAFLKGAVGRIMKAMKGKH
ncbi:MAG: DUF2334 domain-containing protein [Lachnospiraceae bacterium]|nr:DUF2334 domain-containing protein [Lachnospiraceae bacterium]